MHYWNTGDEAINANLAYLDSLANDNRPPFDAEQTFQKFASMIEVTQMLPRAVLAHFNLPPLFIGDGSHRWPAEVRSQKVQELCAALSAGLQAVKTDASLKAGGADLSDRSRTKGEEIDAALQAFKAAWPAQAYEDELRTLRSATQGTRMQSDVDEIIRQLARKRWSGPFTPADEIRRRLGSIDFHAGRHHHRRAELS